MMVGRMDYKNVFGDVPENQDGERCYEFSGDKAVASYVMNKAESEEFRKLSEFQQEKVRDRIRKWVKSAFLNSWESVELSFFTRNLRRSCRS